MNLLNFWVWIGQLRVTSHLDWLMSENNFQTQNSICFSMSVFFFFNVLLLGLGFFDGTDALETIKSQFCSTPSSVPTQHCPKTPKHGGNPGRNGPHSILLHVLITEIFWNLQKRTKKQKKKSDRERESISSSYNLPLLELKMDSWRNASMAVSRDCDCSPPSNTWDSFTLVGHSDGTTNTRPPQEGKRGEEEREEN